MELYSWIFLGLIVVFPILVWIGVVMELYLWIFIGLIVAFPILVWIGIRLESKAFNKGVCKKCGRKLKYFDTDSQGGRGYKCEACNYHTWVSYLCVDKDYWKGKEWRSDIL